VIGVDPARKGDDRTAIIRRRGRRAYKLETHYNIDTMELAGIVKRIIEQEHPKRVCIDSIGIGAGVVDRLHELGHDIVEGVNVARRASEPEKYKNLRAELWDWMREWFVQEMPVQIPDSDELQTDLVGLGYKYDSSDKLQIEGKDDAKKRGLLSPDCFIAGTMVDTPRGKIPIEMIKVGDYVCTPKGNHKVIRNHKSLIDFLTTCKFSNGSSLTGKGSHKIFTWNRGWVTMDALMLTDSLESNSWPNKMKWLILKTLFTKDKNTDFKHQVDIISQAGKMSRKDFYTDAYGEMHLALSQRADTYITKMATGLITELKTLKRWMVLNIERCIQKNHALTPSTWLNFEKAKRRLLLKPLSGTKKVFSDIAKKGWDKPRKTGTIKCHNCSNLFESVFSGRKSVRFCSRKCSLAGVYQKQKTDKRVCAFCDKEFMANKYRPIKCCSYKCSAGKRASDKRLQSNP
jgi:hypothetical protein